MSRSIAVAALIGAALLAPGTAGAATPIGVTTTADGTTCSTTCSLRGAIVKANGTSGADTINLPPGKYTLSLPGTGEDAGATGDLDVTDDLTINGGGSSVTTIDAAGIDRVLDTLSGARLTLQGVTLTNGDAGTGDGGAIQASGSLSTTDVVATHDAGASVVTIDDSDLSDTMSLDHTTLSGNQPTGKVLDTTVSTTLTDSRITGNTVSGTSPFPGLFDFEPFLPGAPVSLTLLRTSIDHNTLSQGAPLLDIDPSTGFNPSVSSIRLTDSAFASNTVDQSGPLVDVDPCGGTTTQVDMAVTRTTFAGNKVGATTGSGSGGALEWDPCSNNTPNAVPQKLAIADSLFDDNVAGPVGGGEGGALVFDGPDEGTLTITGSTFSSNRAGTSGSSEGGAIELAGGALTITNSTFTANKAPAAADLSQGGGGIFVDSGASLTLHHVTMAGNSTGANGTGGGIYDANNSIDRPARAGAAVPPSTAVHVDGSILYGNTAGTAASDCSTPPTDGGSNLEGATTCAFAATGDHQNANPLLGALANNGGPTPTMAIAATSPAKDAAAATGCPAADQRGIARPQGTACDIGAYELVQNQGGGGGGGGGGNGGGGGGGGAGGGGTSEPKLTELIELPSTKKCVDRRKLRMTVRRAHRKQIKQVTTRINHSKRHTWKGRRLKHPLVLHHLPRGHFTLRVAVRLKDGHTVKGKRRYHACAPKHHHKHTKT